MSGASGDAASNWLLVTGKRRMEKATKLVIDLISLGFIGFLLDLLSFPFTGGDHRGGIRPPKDRFSEDPGPLALEVKIVPAARLELAGQFLPQ
jgi:hypothetical protein